MLVTWTMNAEMEFEAPSKKEAIDMAYDADLPKGNYLDNSFEVFEDLVEELPND